MRNRYQFREIKQEEIPQMFHLIQQRMKWMDETGIRQWNVMNYDQVYPQSYYEAERRKGEVFVLQDQWTGQIHCAALLKEQDERWQEDSPALYLHSFVSRMGANGAGAIFLQAAEEYAAQKGKTYLRLDSAEGNHALARYYESQGFLPVGTCKDGPYQGILRQKELKRSREIVCDAELP